MTDHWYVRVLAPFVAVVFRDLRVYLVLDSGCTQRVTGIFRGKPRLCCTFPLTSLDPATCLVKWCTKRSAAVGYGRGACVLRTMKRGTLFPTLLPFLTPGWRLECQT